MLVACRCALSSSAYKHSFVFPLLPSIFPLSFLFFIYGDYWLKIHPLRHTPFFVLPLIFLIFILFIYHSFLGGVDGCPLLPTDLALLFGCLIYALIPAFIVVFTLILFLMSCWAPLKVKYTQWNSMALHESACEICFIWSKCTKKKKLDGNEYGTSEWCCVFVCLPSCAWMRLIF